MINNPYDFVVVRLGHILTSQLTDQDKLDAIRITYKEAFFPEKGILPHEISLIKKLYAVVSTDE